MGEFSYKRGGNEPKEANRAFRINKSMQRVRKEALNQVDDGCIIKVFPDKLERSTTSLILKSTKTACPLCWNF